MISSRGILLDTHVWLRYLGISGPLSKGALAAIHRAVSAGEAFVPVISIWEFAMLAKSGRLQISIPISQWIQEVLQRPGLQLLGFTPEIAVESVNLPAPMHKDPADRIIVASARVERLALVTRDKDILDFARLTGLAHMQA